MKDKKKIILTLALLIAGPLIFAQTSLNVVSNSVQIDGTTYEYAIGEMALIQTNQNTNLIVTQGFFQPNNFATKTQSNNALNTENSLMVAYPNPTKNELFIETSQLITADIKFQLFDGAGKLVLEVQKPKNEGADKFSIQMEKLATGNYFLIGTTQTTTNSNYKQIFKIQKTDY
jgi:metal-dependent amidase/aminoacylase/carboxypeptidase family protein